MKNARKKIKFCGKHQLNSTAGCNQKHIKIIMENQYQ